MEKRSCNGEKDFLASGVGESDLTESESHLNMMKDGGSALQSIFHPPLAPSEHSSSLVNYCVCVLVTAVCVISYLTTYHGYSILGLELWILAALGVCMMIFSGCVALICRQPQTSKKVSFMVPLLPFLPILSVFVNIYLMVQLSGDTWIRFSVWMAVGFLIYFGYGMWHSVERQRHLQSAVSSSSKKSTTKKKSAPSREKQGGAVQDKSICPEKTSQC